jgi:hypothetical protein
MLGTFRDVLKLFAVLILNPVCGSVSQTDAGWLCIDAAAHPLTRVGARNPEAVKSLLADF